MQRNRILQSRSGLLKGETILLSGLILLYAIMALMYDKSAPLAIKPDENWHLAYVEYLQNHDSLPVVDLNNSRIAGRPRWEPEGHQPPLYYALVELLSADSNLDDIERLYYENPHYLSTVWGNKNPWVPQASQAFVTFHTARLLSLVFGVLTVIATYGLARTFLPATLTLFAAAFTAFNPQFLFISTSFSNDMAATAICTAAIWLTATGIGHPFTLRRALVLGILIGLGTLTKLSGFVLAGVLPLIILLDQLIWHKRDESPWRILGLSALLVLVACLIPLPWFIRNWQLYGDPFGTAALQSMMGQRVGMIPPQVLGDWLGFVWKAFWLDFSPGGILFGPSWLYWGFGIILLAAAAGLLAAWRKLSRERPYIILCGTWLFVYTAALLFTMVRSLRPMGGGRLLFPVSSALSVLVAVGLLYLASRRWRTIVAWALTAYLVFLAVYSWAFILEPNYSLPTMGLEKADALPNHSSIRFGDSIVLCGWRIGRNETAPEQVVPVTLYWHRTEPIAKNYSVFLQVWPLGTGSELGFRGVDSYPGLGVQPTSRWPQGRILLDEYPLPILASGAIEEPMGVDVMLGMYDLETSERLAITVGDQPAGDHVSLGQLTIRPTTALTMPEAARLPQAYPFDTGLQLVGWQVDSYETPLCVELWWQGADTPREDLTVFLHAYDAAGSLVAQADGPPRQGQFPTYLWRAQDLVRDQHCFSQPLTGDLVRLETGLYDLATLERLPAYDPAGNRLPNDAVVLRVQPQ